MSLTSSPSHDILTKLLKSSVDKAIYRKKLRCCWPLGQEVKTSPFHGGNVGSIPAGVIRWEQVPSKQEPRSGS